MPGVTLVRYGGDGEMRNGLVGERCDRAVILYDSPSRRRALRMSTSRAGNGGATDGSARKLNAGLRRHITSSFYSNLFACRRASRIRAAPAPSWRRPKRGGGPAGNDARRRHNVERGLKKIGLGL